MVPTTWEVLGDLLAGETENREAERFEILVRMLSSRNSWDVSSISMTSLGAKEQKSAIQCTHETCRRKRAPVALFLRAPQTLASDTVRDRRMALARAPAIGV
jgi:hypothetical protein